MTEIINILNQEIKTLENKIQKLQKNLCNYPEGTLQINHCNGSIQYYHKNYREKLPEETHVLPKYIRKDDKELARQLAQKDYDKKLLKLLEKRKQSAQKMKAIYLQGDPAELYEKCYSERKKLIVPEYISDEEYSEKWQQVEYQGKKFAEGLPEIYTVKGERVRSKSEKIIADTFERKKIPYRYEFPLKLSDTKIIYPDFTVLNKRTRKTYFWEHLGMMDDEEYAQNSIKRIREMELAGIIPGGKLIITAETRENPVSIKEIDIMIKEYLT